MKNNFKVSIIIPNWNGQELLKKNLPKVSKSNPDEIIVVDDASIDDSLEILKKFKEIKVLTHKKNLGFVSSVNDGIKTATGNVVVLLNTDVVPDKTFLPPLISYFKDPKVFAVSCAEKDYSWAWAKFKDGLIEHGMGEVTDKIHLSFWASGGSAAFSRRKWLELDGMDDIYKPFYWEDIDICYRAQKRGWQILWEPDSKVFHQHESTIAKYFSRSYMDYISQRNQLLFIWKNITSKSLLVEHQKALAKQLVSGKMWRPFLGALVKLPAVLKKREIEKKEMKVIDEEIFAKFEF